MLALSTMCQAPDLDPPTEMGIIRPVTQCQCQMPVRTERRMSHDRTCYTYASLHTASKRCTASRRQLRPRVKCARTKPMGECARAPRAARARSCAMVVARCHRPFSRRMCCKAGRGAEGMQGWARRRVSAAVSMLMPQRLSSAVAGWSSARTGGGVPRAAVALRT